MFVKHCKVEVYLTELKLCEDSNMDNVITRRFSKADTIGRPESLWSNVMSMTAAGYTQTTSFSRTQFFFYIFKNLDFYYFSFFV